MGFVNSSFDCGLIHRFLVCRGGWVVVVVVRMSDYCVALSHPWGLVE